MDLGGHGSGVAAPRRDAVGDGAALRHDPHAFDGGLVAIGHDEAGFAFDNEGPAHKVWLERMAERGWTAPEWPREYGGGGLTATPLALVLIAFGLARAVGDALGQRLTPTPLKALAATGSVLALSAALSAPGAPAAWPDRAYWIGG